MVLHALGAHTASSFDDMDFIALASQKAQLAAAQAAAARAAAMQAVPAKEWIEKMNSIIEILHSVLEISGNFIFYTQSLSGFFAEFGNSRVPPAGRAARPRG